MAAIFRIGLCKLVNSSGKLLPNTAELNVFTRNIMGKTMRQGLVETTKKSQPFPYNTKRYRFLGIYREKTIPKFDENSKLIVVEGSVAVGKTAFAKELADDLGMLYLPEANIDMLFTNSYNFNLKKLDPLIPESCRSFDIKDFLINPNHRLTGAFQLRQFLVKYSQYVDALAHVFNTGQGVVLDRCVYSDFVFLEAMFKSGFVSRGVRSVYYEARQNTLWDLLKPHLVIYLDVPVSKVAEKIKARNNSVETKSRALTPAYLQHLENYYKQDYLREISTHAELLVYDWSEGGDVEVVVEDIERIDFSSYDVHDLKLLDWRLDEKRLCERRYMYTDRKGQLMNYLNIPRYDVPELVTEAQDMYEYRKVLQSAPGEKFAYGFNTSCGDTGILFKTGVWLGSHSRDTLPCIERKFPETQGTC